MSRTAVVILNYNGRDWLRKFLPSVIRFSPEARIVVADNSSTDDSVEMVSREFETVEIIRIPTNKGYCGGYNFALRQVHAEYFVLLNSDVLVTQNWLKPIIQLFEEHPTLGAAQPKILSYHKQNEFEYAGASGGFIDTLGYPFCRGRIFNHLEKDEGQYNDTCPVFWATGACLFIRAELFHTIGGLDEDFFAHMEEIDMCWRLHRAGFDVYYQAQSQVYHVGGGTLSAANPKKTYYNFKNGLSLIFKNMSTGQLLWKFPLRLMLDWIAATRFLIGGSAANSWAVLKAHIDFFAGLGKELKKRRELKQKFPFTDKGIYRGSVVVDFYLLGRKTFSKLGIQ